jgi:uridine phosphorylase
MCGKIPEISYEANERVKTMSDPIITPKKFLAKVTFPPEAKGCTLAIVGFCKFNDMKVKLSVEPMKETIFSHLDKSHQFIGRIGSHKILAAECLYGGPLSATVLEEVAHYGIETVIGYGYAGSLRRQIPIGQIVLADAAIISDGTSREYLPKDQMAHPDPTLVQPLDESAKELGKPIMKSTIWTTDAIYREYPEKIEEWRGRGADVVNMDTSYFYAISQVVKLSSIYACVVSDCVDGPIWDAGFGRSKAAMWDLQDVIIRTASKILQ